MNLSKTFTLIALFCIAHSLPAVINSETSVTRKDRTYQDLSALQVEAEIHPESNSRDFISHLEKRTNPGGRPQGRKLYVPNYPGRALVTVGGITIEAIVNTANQLIWEITNRNSRTCQVEIREVDSLIAAAVFDVAGYHKTDYDTYGGILPGDVVNVMSFPA